MSTTDKKPVGSNQDNKQGTAEKEQENQQRVRIRIRAYDHKIIDQCTRNILETAERTGATISGPVPLPTEKKKYTVNRSTFVHKDAREQYDSIDAMMSINWPAGVEVEIKM
jgi:small subunit ribosomal protein S10